MNKLILKYDSRDKIFSNRFGQVIALSDIPDEINFDTNFPDERQSVGDVKCVLHGTCDIAEDQQNLEFDFKSINDLWERVPKFPGGTDPRDVLGEAVNNGILPKKGKERMKRWASYWRADIGLKDPFDNVRSTMMLIKSPVGVGSYWYSNWHGKGILPIGENPQNGHFYVIEGWKQINGQPHFIIEAWAGRKMYMSRDVFNAALKPTGMQTWVLSTADMDTKRVKTLYETIKDFLINLIIKLRDLQNESREVVPTSPESLPKVEEVKPEPELKLILWASGIEKFENMDKSFNNPGAIRALNGKFLRFKTREEGWQHLLDYLRRAATGRHLAYKKKGETTLLEFFKIYAPAYDNNNPTNYARFVAKHIGVDTSEKIKNLV